MRDEAAIDWDNTSVFTILLGNASVDDSFELLHELNSLDQDVMAEPAGAGPLEDIMIVVTVLNGTAEAIKYTIAAVKVVQRWMAKMRKKGIEPDVRLQRGFMDDVKITVETDADVDVTVIVHRRAGQSEA